jgi:hypothetical protein
MDKDEPIQDKPDLVIDFNNRKTLILDAKNFILPLGKIYPYRRQMDSYITLLEERRPNLAYSSSLPL